MKQQRRSDGLPPNFDLLPEANRRIAEEEQYRRQCKHSFGYCPGDPRLTSMNEVGLPLSGSFGKKVEDMKSKEVVVDEGGDREERDEADV